VRGQKLKQLERSEALSACLCLCVPASVLCLSVCLSVFLCHLCAVVGWNHQLSGRDEGESTLHAVVAAAAAEHADVA
jgi:hypothetical protein